MTEPDHETSMNPAFAKIQCPVARLSAATLRSGSVTDRAGAGQLAGVAATRRAPKGRNFVGCGACGRAAVSASAWAIAGIGSALQQPSPLDYP